MPLPPRTMSIHNAPQPGEALLTFSGVTAPIERFNYRAGRPAGMNTLRGAPRLNPRDKFTFTIVLTPEQEEADAREQQAIADAVEGVIP